MKNELVAILKDFPKINLDQLNASAKFMERMENKYIVDNDQLQQFFKKAHKKYYILQIKEKVVFSYQNVYMDTKDYFFYHEHEHKKHKRVKLRTRQYVDSHTSVLRIQTKRRRSWFASLDMNAQSSNMGKWPKTLKDFMLNS
jgi:hypothetical protein